MMGQWLVTVDKKITRLSSEKGSDRIQKLTDSNETDLDQMKLTRLNETNLDQMKLTGPK